VHKLVVLYSAPADPAHFREYYLTIHLPLVLQMPGMLACRYSFDITTPSGASPYFAIFEADFADADAMAASRASEQGLRASADVPNYATGGATVIHYPTTVGSTAQD